MYGYTVQRHCVLDSKQLGDVDCTLYCVCSVVYIVVYNTVTIVYVTVYIVYCTVTIVFFTVYSVYCTLVYSLYSAMLTVH